MRNRCGLPVAAVVVAAWLVVAASVVPCSADAVSTSGWGLCKGMFLSGSPPDSLMPYDDDTYVKLCKTLNYPGRTDGGGGGEALYASLFNKKLRIPEWVAYKMKYHGPSMAGRDGCGWSRDDDIKALETADKSTLQAKDSDYKNSGWQRGHLLPASTVSYSQDAQCTTFQFSNCVPQSGSLNHKEWVYTEYLLRNYLHTLWQDGHTEEVYVVTGVTVAKGKPATMSKNKITIPAGMYTAVYNPKKSQGFAVYADNKASQPSANMAAGGFLKIQSIDDLEARLGANVFPDSRGGCFVCIGGRIAKDGGSLPYFQSLQSKRDPYSVGDVEECMEMCDSILTYWCEGKQAKAYCRKTGSFFSEKRARCRQYSMVMHRGDVADQIIGGEEKREYNFKAEWATLCTASGHAAKQKKLCNSNGFCSLATFTSPAKVAKSAKKEGWLWKKSWATLHLSSRFYRQYFVLDHSALLVFESDTAYTNAPQKPKYTLSLSHVLDVPGVENVGEVTNEGRHCFRLVTTDKKRFVICGDTKKERNEWVAALESHKKQFFPVGLPGADPLEALLE